jgi:hypothetical protein
LAVVSVESINTGALVDTDASTAVSAAANAVDIRATNRLSAMSAGEAFRTIALAVDAAPSVLTGTRAAGFCLKEFVLVAAFAQLAIGTAAESRTVTYSVSTSIWRADWDVTLARALLLPPAWTTVSAVSVSADIRASKSNRQ